MNKTQSSSLFIKIGKSNLYIVGVSGGPDSFFLLDNLRREKYKIIVAHVNYKKRIDSDFDEKLVRDYCNKNSLLLEVHKLSNNAECSFSRKNFQDYARQVRYEFFQYLAKKYNTKYVIVAHHFDDHLETYLLQKKRKSLVNHWGLSTFSKWKKIWIVRPLLHISKEEILQYLTNKNINYAVDYTNQLPIYQRNIIRQEILNHSQKQKEEWTREIIERNHQLKKAKSTIKTESKRIITPNGGLLLEENTKLSKEIYLRLLYFWINKRTNFLLQKKKKKLLNEIYKQLFISKKSGLIIMLSNNFKIVKLKGQAFVCNKNN